MSDSRRRWPHARRRRADGAQITDELMTLEAFQKIIFTAHTMFVESASLLAIIIARWNNWQVARRDCLLLGRMGVYVCKCVCVWVTRLVCGTFVSFVRLR